MTQITIDGPQGNLATLRSASPGAPALVFLHADPGRASQWMAVIALLAPNFDSIAIDIRGAGASDPAADGDYGFDGRANDVAAAVVAFDLTRFVIVAHSSGVAVALAYAEANRDKVTGIVMVDPAIDPRAMPADIRDGFVKALAGPDSFAAFQTYVGSIAGENAGVRQQVLADAVLLGPQARAGLAAAFAGWNPEVALDAYNGPVFILSTPATDIDGALYRLRPDIPHQVVQTEGHWLQLDHPDVVADAIKLFMAGVDLRQGAE